MAVIYNCACRDGRVITGTPKWELSALKKMNPLQLADVLSEMLEFARYYESNFYFPQQKLSSEAETLTSNFWAAKRRITLFGVASGFFTFVWLLLVLLPAFRYSNLTLAMSVMTFLSILFFIPVIFSYLSAQETVKKRLPRVNSKLERLNQKQEKQIFGFYQDYLIGGYLVSPEYSLSSEALEVMIQAFRSRNASNISEATAICRKKFLHSPVPPMIASLQSVSDPAEKPQELQTPPTPPQKPGRSPFRSQEPDLATAIQLSEYLNSALKTLAAAQAAPSDASSSIASTVTPEEERLIREYRTLSLEEQKRILRVVHSFYTKRY